ncbi:MAG: flagellar hook-length control protein FliK [Bdellovibrionaceae bacterium]|nr:flagellar hook-length control protein FliK [Pseudobdellovibrionaceae bacterium]
MDSFESEFGIPPTKIVEAMALLQPQDLNKAPEETAEAVIAHLDLPEEDQEEAQAMYAALLLNLSAADRMGKPTAFSEKEPLMAPPMVQARLSQAQEKRTALNQSVDQLNQKFWMTNGKAMEPKTPGPVLSAPMMMDGMDEGTGMEPMPMTDVNASALQALGMEMEADQPLPPDMQRLLREMKDAAQAATSGEGAESETPLKEAALASQAPVETASANSPREAKPAEVSGTPNAAAEAPAWTSPMDKSTRQEQSFGEGQGGSRGESSSSGKKESSASGGKGFQSAMSAPQPLRMEDVAAALKANPLPAAGSTAAALSMTPADNEANVRQLMNQAQYLIKKGGGEVKVEMTPEGLGQIQMKVLVKDGKVNVQMLTESPEAKKAIDGSLSDLRSSLAAHKLSMDHVKVDVVSGTNTDSQTRNDSNMNQNPQRDGNRQFWNQFQENFGNRGAREGFWDMPNLKGYRQMRRPDPLQPIDAPGVAAGRKAEGKGRGLDLVA